MNNCDNLQWIRPNIKSEDIYNLIHHDSLIVALFESQLYKEKKNGVRNHKPGTSHNQSWDRYGDITYIFVTNRSSHADKSIKGGHRG